MKNTTSWTDTMEKFERWWAGDPVKRPLMRVIIDTDEPTEPLEKEIPFDSNEDRYINVEKNMARFRNRLRRHLFAAEAFPAFSMNFGPGSLATYLGSEPIFAQDTVWYTDIAKDGYNALKALQYDPKNSWWQLHLEMHRKAREHSCDEFLIAMPDLVEGVDILAAMRGPQALCFDLKDRPQVVEQHVRRLDDLYFCYYDRLMDIIKMGGGTAYTAFDIWGLGRTAKVQCDFCAMMSPADFAKYVKPSLQKQCAVLDHSLYHLDGPDCIRHLDALMSIDELDALQFTPGVLQPDGGHPKWYPIYDQVKAAGKSLWVALSDQGFATWIERAQNLVNRYGTDGLYVLFPVMNQKQATILLERKW